MIGLIGQSIRLRTANAQCVEHSSVDPRLMVGKEAKAVLRRLLVLRLSPGILLLLSGCCWFSKRSCFPVCPPPTPVVVEVEKACELPPAVVLADVQTGPLLILDGETYRPATSAEEKKKAKGILLPISEAGKLAQNLGALKTWIRETRARCGPRPASQPTSRPVP